jgi:hypothetical protein
MPAISSFQLSSEKSDYVSPLSQYAVPYVYSSISLLNSAGDGKCLACAVRQTKDLFDTVSGPERTYAEIPSSITLPEIPALPVPPAIYFSINWATTYFGTLDGNPWAITTGGNSVRFNVEDSANCGGLNGQTQGGTATATIQTGDQAVLFSLAFSGIGELQDTGFENISFFLDGVLLAEATSDGQGLGCAMGPVLSTFFTSFPILLAANTVYTFEIDFNTGDSLYHVGAFYQIDLTFSPA